MTLDPRSGKFTVLLGAMAALPPLSIDMNLPAIPSIADALGATAAQSGLTLSAFLVGFAVAQLVLGPMSDRYGRRPVLLAGLVLYSFAGLGCALAGSIETLVLCRLVEGAGAASGTVLAFAIVRDTTEGLAARVRLSTVVMVLAVAPVIAPTLGTFVLGFAPWRGIFAALSLAGVLLLVVVAVWLPETRPPGMRPGVLAAYQMLARHRRVMGFALVNGFGFAMMFAYISGSPRVVMVDLGRSPTVFSVMFAATASGIMLASFLSGRLARAGFSGEVPLVTGTVLSLGGSGAAAALMALGPPALVWLVPLMILAVFGRGLITPNATHEALTPFPALAGAASAVTGAVQMALGAAASLVVGALYPALGPQAMTLTMTICAALAVLAWAYAAGGATAAQPA